MSIITAPDSAAIVAAIREKLTALGLLREGECRNSYTAKALDQCVLVKKIDLQFLLEGTHAPAFDFQVETLKQTYGDEIL